MKKNKRLEIQKERLQEFNHQTEDHYEERKIGSEWWIKSYSGVTNRWMVSIYSEQSYQKYKNYNENKNNFEYAINKE